MNSISPNALTPQFIIRSNSENGVASPAARPISAMLGWPMDYSTAATTASKDLDETKVNLSMSILRVNTTFPPSENLLLARPRPKRDGCLGH
jgi:hypothetical protein